MIRKNFILFLLPAVVACSKRSGKEKDYDPPAITLNSPTNGQVFTAGQNILVSGTVTDNKFIEEIHIEIANLATGEEYLHVHIHPNGLSSPFSQNYTAQAGVNYKIRIIADDASSNSSVKSVEVACN